MFFLDRSVALPAFTKMEKPPHAYNVRYETFLSWKVQEYFDIDVAEVDGHLIVSKIWCRTCRRNSDKVRCSKRLKGQAKSDCLKFANGTENVVKCAVMRHLASLVRTFAIGHY